MTVLACLLVGAALALGVGWAVGVDVRLPHRRVGNARRGSQARFLEQAGVGLSPLQFWCGAGLGGVVALFVVSAVCGSWLVALVPALTVAYAPRAFFARRRTERMRAMQTAWPDALRDIIASISAGRSLTQALEDLAATGPPAMRESLGRYPFLVRMLGTVAALEVIKEELADPTSDRVLEVLILAHERGGSIVKAILEDLVMAIGDDVKLLDEIDTAGLEMKINSRAVLAMPWFVLVLLSAIQDSFRRFYTSPGGAMVIVIGALASGFGLTLLRKLQHAEPEPRVFAAEVAV